MHADIHKLKLSGGLKENVCKQLKKVFECFIKSNLNYSELKLSKFP